MTLALGAVLLAGGFSAVAAEHLGSVNKAYIDSTIPVGEDFYRHVNNGWMKAHPLTDEYARYGMFNVLNDEAESVDLRAQSVRLRPVFVPLRLPAFFGERLHFFRNIPVRPRLCRNLRKVGFRVLFEQS